VCLLLSNSSSSLLKFVYFFNLPFFIFGFWTYRNKIGELGHGKWVGECCAPTGEKFPFEILITARKGKGFIGVTNWVSLNAQTKIHGMVDRENLKWEEFEIISGSDSVVVPVHYTAKLSLVDGIISGKLKDPEQVISTFQLKKEILPRIPSAQDKNKKVNPVLAARRKIKEEKKMQKEKVHSFHFPHDSVAKKPLLSFNLGRTRS
jgi:hypothetical protein